MKKITVPITNSARASVASKPMLTNFASGIMPELQQNILGGSLADFLSPVVPVQSTIGRFKKFDDKNAFQVVNTLRGLGGPAKRLEFTAADGDYNCRPNALEVAIDDAERDADDLGLEQAKTKVVLTTALRSRENEVLSLVDASTSAVGGIGVWSGANDPIDEVNGQILDLMKVTGQSNIGIAIGVLAWEILCKNSKIKDRIKTGIAVLTSNMLSGLFMVPVTLKIGVVNKDTVKEGATASKSFIPGSVCYVFIHNPAPTQYDPSPFKTFRGGKNGIESVRVYREDNNRSDILAVDWSEQTLSTGTACIRKIAVS